MANVHCVAASAVNVPTTTETVVVTMTAFTENQPQGQGIQFDGNINMTVGTAGTAVTVRVRRGVDTTGTLIGVAQAQTVAAGNTVNIPIAELDTVVVQQNVTYVVTVQQTAATANGTVNRVVFAAQDATAFE